MKKVQLFKPHTHQRTVLKALEDDRYFFVTLVIGRQWGKTTLAENICIKWALESPNQTIYWVSPTDSQSQKVYKQIIAAVIQAGVIKSKKGAKGDTEIVFANQSRILLQIIAAVIQAGVIKSKKGAKGDTEIVFANQSRILFRSALSVDSLRGESIHYLVLEECAFIKSDTINEVLLPMLAAKGKKLFAISTPKGKQGWLYQAYLNGQSDEVEHCKWVSFRFSTYDSPYVKAEFIDSARQSLSSKQFDQEIEAQFIDSSSVFDNISDLMVLDPLEEPDSTDSYVAGLDLGLVADATVLSIINKKGDLVKQYRWQKINAPVLIQQIISINAKWGLRRLMVESNGIGRPLIDDLKQTLKNISEFNTSAKSKSEIINRLIALFQKKQMKLVNDEQLRMELEGFIFVQKDGGAISYRADYGVNDDCVMSLAIARHCYDKMNYNPRYLAIY